MFKFLLVIVALAAGAAAAPSQSELGRIDSLVQLNEILKRMLELYEQVQDSGLVELDIGQVISEFTTPENMVIFLKYALDNFGGLLRQEYSCMLRVIIETNYESQEGIRKFLLEIVNYVQLVRERDAKREECDNIDTSTMIGVVTERNCRLHQTNLELQVNMSYFLLTGHMMNLRQTFAEGFACMTT